MRLAACPQEHIETGQDGHLEVQQQKARNRDLLAITILSDAREVIDRYLPMLSHLNGVRNPGLPNRARKQENVVRVVFRMQESDIGSQRHKERGKVSLKGLDERWVVTYRGRPARGRRGGTECRLAEGEPLSASRGVNDPSPDPGTEGRVVVDPQDQLDLAQILLDTGLHRAGLIPEELRLLAVFGPTLAIEIRFIESVPEYSRDRNAVLHVLSQVPGGSSARWRSENASRCPRAARVYVFIYKRNPTSELEADKTGKSWSLSP